MAQAPWVSAWAEGKAGLWVRTSWSEMRWAGMLAGLTVVLWVVYWAGQWGVVLVAEWAA